MIHVVIVEDNRHIAFLLTFKLKSIDSIDAVHIPSENFYTNHLFWKFPQDDEVVGIIDLMLGTDMTGVDVARWVREEFGDDPRLIALTAAGRYSDIFVEAEESGFFDYLLTKPTTHDELIDAIHGEL